MSNKAESPTTIYQLTQKLQQGGSDQIYFALTFVSFVVSVVFLGFFAKSNPDFQVFGKKLAGDMFLYISLGFAIIVSIFFGLFSRIKKKKDSEKRLMQIKEKFGGELKDVEEEIPVKKGTEGTGNVLTEIVTLWKGKYNDYTFEIGEFYERTGNSKPRIYNTYKLKSAFKARFDMNIMLEEFEDMMKKSYIELGKNEIDIENCDFELKDKILENEEYIAKYLEVLQSAGHGFIEVNNGKIIFVSAEFIIKNRYFNNENLENVFKLLIETLKIIKTLN